MGGATHKNGRNQSANQEMGWAKEGSGGDGLNYHHTYFFKEIIIYELIFDKDIKTTIKFHSNAFGS